MKRQTIEEKIRSAVTGFDLICYPRNSNFIYRFNQVIHKIDTFDGEDKYQIKQVHHTIKEDGFLTYYVSKLSFFMSFGNTLDEGGFERFTIKLTDINPYNLFGANSILHGINDSTYEDSAAPYVELMDFLKYIGYYSSDDSEDKPKDQWLLKNVICSQDFYVNGHPEFYLELFRRVAMEASSKQVSNKKGYNWNDQWDDDIVSIRLVYLKKLAKKYNNFLEDNKLTPVKKKELKLCENRLRFQVCLKTPQIIRQFSNTTDGNLLLEILSGKYQTAVALIEYADKYFSDKKWILSDHNSIPKRIQDEYIVINGDNFDKTFTKLFYSWKTCKVNMSQYVIV